jgi:hypothetical protein
MTARREVEIRVRLPKTTGGPSEVLALLADHQLATLTRSCCADHEGLLLLLITSQTEEVQQVLEAAGYRCHTHPVVLLGPTTYRPGVAARLFAELGQQGVDIRYSYLSSIAPDRCFLIVETTNDERALEVVAAAA